MDRESFLQNYRQFQLGHLITEQAHTLTRGFSDLAKTDLRRALELFHRVDEWALKALLENAQDLEVLQRDILSTLQEGGRIFLCGCGATGRLSLLLESLWRECSPNPDQVVSLMAGGDIALVHSLEGFEDYPSYGEKHLKQLNFDKKDLLIGISEGGETPYVIGAVQAAAQTSIRKPYFIFCNPKDDLQKTVERSRAVIESKDIETISLVVGPMALAGSTRLQASTVLQLAVGLALFEPEQDLRQRIEGFIEFFHNQNYDFLQDLIAKEADFYSHKEYVMYAPRAFATTVFTDTTERAPTFSLPYFEDENSKPTSWCYVLIPQAENGAQAWATLLGRKPRALEWNQVDVRTSEKYLQRFNFSRNILDSRQERLGEKRQHLFSIEDREGRLELALGGVEVKVELPQCVDSKGTGLLLRHTFVKMILNAHSTLLMGRMGRYQSNIMTWVKPSNGKLIDRAVRYVSLLLHEKGQELPYLTIASEIFRCLESLPPNESVVMKVYKLLENQK